MLGRCVGRVVPFTTALNSIDPVGAQLKFILSALSTAIFPRVYLEDPVHIRNYASGLTLPAPKDLGSILKLETVQNAPTEEIAHIWNEYHFRLGRGHVSSVLDRASFQIFKERAGACPQFVLPLKKPAGFITMFSQAQLPRVLFTGLEDFKIRGPQASPYLVSTHYDDLAESKDIVLVRGDIILPAHLSDDEARELLEACHAFYLRRDLFDHVQAFNRNSAEFDFNEVLRTRGISLA